MGALKDAVTFGIGSNEAAGLTATESVSMTTRMDKAEVFDENGETKSVEYYNEYGDFTATGYGLASAPAFFSNISAMGGLDPDSHQSGSDSNVLVTGITEESSNEEFVKFTITGIFFKDITA